MPSNFKKNKRRCKRAQAQKRALEEQAAKSPGNVSPGISVREVQKKVTETSLPAQEKVPQPIPTDVPIVETPPVEVKPVVVEEASEPISVQIVTKEPEALVLEKTRTDVEAVQEVPAPVNEKVSAVKAETTKKAEPIILETKQETEVKAKADIPVKTFSETQIHATVITGQTEQTSNVCEPETEVAPEVLPEKEAAAEAGVEMIVTESAEKLKAEAQTGERWAEDAVAEAAELQTSRQASGEAEPAADEEVTESGGESVEEPIARSREDPAVEAQTSEQDACEAEPAANEAATEKTFGPALTEVPEAEQVDEALSPEEVGAEADIPAEPLTTEPLPTRDISDSLVGDFVVTESASAVELPVSKSAAPPTEAAEVSSILSAQTDPTDAPPTGQVPAVAPAEGKIVATPEQKCVDLLSEEPKSQTCDRPLQMQRAVESVEMSAETSLNGHLAQVVSIES